ncbi:AmmeMemoRadiSam system protein B [Thiohalobacter thiocyanaticus]|uniref:MEMO1 family protein D6C00_02115 n=1 Tax=Thiohalobacter thiocyanaticus TaxID=585455 RepID=A0A426QGJ9_9GAMM|nr:AmmeMemoRadiSam system protein B [Thiohalobacter thiocyanaticus]RRQ20877.1 AmmeMemoRadiSam system protein B [Thiohalobacter thiocyanaticus]
MSQIRQPAVAGMFYPDDPAVLRRQVRDLLAAAESPTEPPPKAIIAPHAGYVYSGPVAASVYGRLGRARDHIRRVVLLGPSHRVPFHGLAAPSSEAFRTPLGDIPVDTEAIAGLRDFPQVQVRDDAHALEHSLEVQLPFLQEVLGEFRLIPLVVGDASYAEVREVLDHLWGGEETLIVISSDLSHYHDYDTARALDRATSVAIEALAPERIDYDHACGRTPVGGLLQAARARGLHAHTLDLRNSGDTAGPRDRVVGYGAYAID